MESGTCNLLGRSIPANCASIKVWNQVNATFSVGQLPANCASLKVWNQVYATFSVGQLPANCASVKY